MKEKIHKTRKIEEKEKSNTHMTEIENAYTRRIEKRTHNKREYHV